ncbi:ABC transporter substrate-binding protein [Jiangella ureilytica]|uniref:ABC transporter substrate-binding protein n=1 Tax=Jiangella ureilytica TaxID=2530374 RepID=A0A4R4RF98_9ACTN|nr:ABC transporter substrate-binding protein [Jiangella ureilytica]TDC48038.1 ABC transporter substrate-binding protein [Jiangella ureilytica]
MRKKSLVAAVMLGAASLAACSGGDTDDAASGDGPVTITFWNGFTSADRPVLEGLVEEFNDSQDDYTVDMTIIPWDTMYQQLMPAYQAGEGPTLVAMDPARLPGYASRGVLAPMDDLYAPDGPLDPEVLPRASIDATVYEDTQYGAPMSAGAGMLYWNKTLFANAGLTEPPTTLEEMADYAAQITAIDPNDETKSVYGIALPDHESLSPWPVLLWAEGGGIYDDEGSRSLLAEPESVETMQYWADKIRNEHISPVGLSGADADALLLGGRAAMHIAGPWLSSGMVEAGIDYGVVPVPSGSEGQFSPAVSVNIHLDADASEAEKEASYAFLEYWNSTEVQQQWAVGTSYPPNRSDIPVEDLAENPTSVAFTEAVNPKFYQAGLLDFADLERNVVTPTFQRIFAGEGEVQDLLEQAAEQIDAQLGAS